MLSSLQIVNQLVQIRDYLKMLAVFHPTVASPPQEITVPGTTPVGQSDSAGILKAYKDKHAGTVAVDFGKKCAMAYSHDKQDPLRPRNFAVVDDFFCMFEGTLENHAQLRQQYGIINTRTTEVTLIIEIYRALRDRSPDPADHVLRGIKGSFAFVLYDNSAETIFVAVDGLARVPFYWGTVADGSLAFSDDTSLLKETCGKSFASFPQGCFFSSAEGLKSYEYPLSPLKPMPRVDSQGQVCGANFKVVPVKHTLRANTFPRVGSESWNTCL